MRQVLLVSRVSGVKDELSRRINAGEEELVIFRADTIQEAKQYLKLNAYDLLIVDIHAPPEVDAPVGADAAPGLEFIKWLRAGGIDTDCVLMRPKRLNATPELDEQIASLNNCIVVQQSMAMYDDLIAAVRSFPSARDPLKPQVLEIELWLGALGSDTGENFYKISFHGADAPIAGALQLGSLNIQVLTKLTELIPELPEKPRRNWKGQFRAVGRLLQEALNEDVDFSTNVKNALERIGHPGRYEFAHLRFVIPRELHAIALESIVEPEKLKDEDGDTDLWMLEAPVYRMLTGIDLKQDYVHPLFDKARLKPIQCLLIDANVEGIKIPSPSDKNRRLHYTHLNEASAECDEVYRMLKDQSERLSIAEPILLRRETGEKGFLKRIEAQLKQDWDLVHYAGHSYLDEQSDKAYFILPDDDQNGKAVPIESIANWLFSARLVYLSSCEGGAAGFVFKLAEAGVPAVVGFRWPIEDTFAAEFAEYFYSHLLERKSVEEAFFLARVQLHNKDDYSDRRAWASPVLIEQKSRG